MKNLALYVFETIGRARFFAADQDDGIGAFFRRLLRGQLFEVCPDP